MSTQFALRLRQSRLAAKMTLDALASALGYRFRSVIGNYETGLSKPTVELVGRMAAILHVSPSWLAGYGSEPTWGAWNPSPHDGTYWLSLAPAERGRFMPVLEAMIVTIGGFPQCIHIAGVTGTFPTNDPIFIGSKWAIRAVPIDPFRS